MRRLLITASLLLAALVPLPLPAAEPATAEQEAERIEAALPSLQEDRRLLQGISAEGASVVAWREGKALRKIAVEALGERGKRLADFYFAGGRLVLAHVRRIDYGMDITESLQGRPLGNDVVEEHRLSFAGERMQQWLEAGAPVAREDKRWRAMQSEILAEARDFRRFVQTTPPAGHDCHWTCTRMAGAGCARTRCE